MLNKKKIHFEQRICLPDSPDVRKEPKNLKIAKCPKMCSGDP